MEGWEGAVVVTVGLSEKLAGDVLGESGSREERGDFRTADEGESIETEGALDGGWDGTFEGDGGTEEGESLEVVGLSGSYSLGEGRCFLGAGIGR